jgi:hypothetical protein
MHIVSCPHCGQREPALNGTLVTCPRCREVTQLSAAADFLNKAEALWPGVEVTLRAKSRITKIIEQHDEYLKKRGDYDIITASLDENAADNAEEGGVTDDGDTEI